MPRIDLPSPAVSHKLHPDISGPFKPLFVKNVDNKILIMKGVIISAVSLADSSSEECLDLDSHLWNLWEETIKRLGSHYTLKALENAFTQTVVAATGSRHLKKRMRRYVKEVICNEPHQEDQCDADVLKFIDDGAFGITPGRFMEKTD